MNEPYVYIDWLGKVVRVGDWIVYSSSSRNTGMNLGKVEYIGPSKKTGAGLQVQVRIYMQSPSGWSKGRLVTLNYRDGAFKSITRYFGIIPGDVSDLLDWESESSDSTNMTHPNG